MSDTQTSKIEASKIETSKIDIVAGHWFERRFPAWMHPYARLMRLDRPIGTWLLLWPCWWSLVLSGAGVYAWHLFIFCGTGAVVMRGAGCTYNDIVDRKIDAQVERTATRPLPSGQVKLWQAVVFLILQLIVGLIILLQFNMFAVWVGAASLVLVFTYPFMKRITYWPQAWLGLTFNWGALLGWAAARGELDWRALVLYVAGIAWTLGYDTIYAHQDREDDELIGVKSSALALGERSHQFIALFFFIALALITLAVPGEDHTLGFWIMMGFAFIHAAWQVFTLDIDDAQNCLTRFRANRDFGALIMLALIASRFQP
ncbi:MAG: 4-hydroxybenzoate octaprenyltransferase [Rhodospirillaceae bacterium]|nr:4-hydroxybenzoate octaprenyltransferase [Rhodospirillaceae bacterium]